MKYVITLCIGLLLTNNAASQILIGIKGGVNWSSGIFYNIQHYGGTINPYPGFSLMADIKGDGPRLVHLGGSVEYYRSSLTWHWYENSHFNLPAEENHLIYENLRLSIFPELTTRGKIRFFANAGPYVTFLVHSTRGAAYSMVNSVGFGLQETAGCSFAVTKLLIITLEERGSMGIPSMSRYQQYGNVIPWSVAVFGGISFLLPERSNEVHSATTR